MRVDGVKYKPLRAAAHKASKKRSWFSARMGCDRRVANRGRAAGVDSPVRAFVEFAVGDDAAGLAMITAGWSGLLRAKDPG